MMHEYYIKNAFQEQIKISRYINMLKFTQIYQIVNSKGER
jgi:hypothetical protein